MCCQQNALSPHFCRQRLDFFSVSKTPQLGIAAEASWSNFGKPSEVWGPPKTLSWCWLSVRETGWRLMSCSQCVVRRPSAAAGGSAGPDQLLLYKGRLFGNVAYSRFTCVGKWEVLSMQFGFFWRGGRSWAPKCPAHLLTRYLVPFCWISSCLINSFLISDPVGAIFCLSLSIAASRI